MLRGITALGNGHWGGKRSSLTVTQKVHIDWVMPSAIKGVSYQSTGEVNFVGKSRCRESHSDARENKHVQPV